MSMFNSRKSRAYTCAVLEMVDDGLIDKDWLIQNLLSWMSEHEVREFCEDNLRDDETNQCLIGFEED